MTSPQARKGKAWERGVLLFLRTFGLRAYKPAQEGFHDVGDIHAGPLVIQAKDWANVTAAVREGLNGAVAQAAAWDAKHTDGARSIPVAVVKRARRPVGDAYAVLRLEDLLRLTTGREHAP